MKVISRHRLPHPYRAALTLLWLTPHGVLTLILALHLRTEPERLAALLDVRYWVPFMLTLIPAVYMWREGIDVLHGGLLARIHIPRLYPYERLGSWSNDPHTGILTLRDQEARIVFETHAAQLTDIDRLIEALEDHIAVHP
ncbi:MAG: hypothetical protein U0670_24145 [Anaerolineae bacterium]